MNTFVEIETELNLARARIEVAKKQIEGSKRLAALFDLCYRGDLRPALNGVHFADNCAVATDGRILARIFFPLLGERKILDGGVFAKDGREISEKFPNVESVIPKKNLCRVFFSAKELGKKLRSLRLSTRGKNDHCPVLLLFVLDGVERRVAVNARYLQKLCKVSDLAGFSTLFFDSGDFPDFCPVKSAIKFDAPDCVVVMPIRGREIEPLAKFDLGAAKRVDV